MLWIKAFHLIAVICWFAGLFYLPRLFVYHAMSEDEASRERFKIMERKLYRGIMTPSLLTTFVLGVWMLYLNWDFYKTQNWMWAKLFLAALLIGYNHWCGYHLKKFAQDKNTRSHIYFRWFNEIPVLILIAVVILVIVRPF
jgi:protoporphyrinogen IX oxidase